MSHTQPEELPPKERALLDAAREGNFEKLKEMLAQGAVIDARDNLDMPWGQTALMYAAEKGHAEVVLFLIDHGANVAARDEAAPGEGGGQQPLHYAMRSKNASVAKLLLDAGAKMDAVDKFGGTPLNVAIASGNREAVSLLLERGLDLKKKPRNKKFEPPLFAAVFAGKVEIVKILLEAGADPNATDGLNQTPLHRVSSVPQAVAIPLIKQLLEAGADVNHADKRGETVFSREIYKKNLESAKLLIESGADLKRIYPGQGGTILNAVEKRIDRCQNSLNDPALRQATNEWTNVKSFLREHGAKHQSEF